MTKIIYFAILFAISLSTQGQTQDASIFDRGHKAPNVHHVGNVWLKEVHVPDSIFNYSISVATFDPGARLDWHSHPGGQILMMIEGTGYYEEKGQPKQTVHKGDVVKCPPGVEHWHGATPESGFAYLAVTPAQQGRTAWGQRVTDDEYHTGSVSDSDNNITEQALIELSLKKWQWMAEKNIDTLATLFHDKAVFVHMGATMTKAEELNVIKTGGIHYKHADIEETTVQFIDDTAILLNKLQLVAEVGGNEVTNPFVVTEVYIRQNGGWKLGSMSFTKLLTAAGQ